MQTYDREPREYPEVDVVELQRELAPKHTDTREQLLDKLERALEAWNREAEDLEAHVKRTTARYRKLERALDRELSQLRG